MLYMLLPLLGGVLLSSLLSSALSLSLALIIPSIIVIFTMRQRWATYTLIAGFGLLVGALDRTPATLLQSYDHQFALIVEQNNTARVVAQRANEAEEWQACRHWVTISGCEAEEYSALLCRGSFTPYERGKTESNHYIASMRKRGYVGAISINRYAPLDHQTLDLRPPLRIRMNRWAVERLKRLQLSESAFAVAAAMGLAQRSYLSEEIKRSYRLSGTSHIMALSGLHFGVVLIIISSVTYLMPIMRHGHIVADIVAIIAIWLFALTAGMGQSVQRSAWMFSLLHLASLTSRRYNGLNALLASATLITIFDPAALFDVGFQLSFLAVFSIIAVGSPLAFWLSARRSTIVNALITSIIIGMVVTLATAPLVAFHFGGVSLMAPLATLPCLLTLTVILFATIIWVIAPLMPLAPLARGVIECATTIQNHIVEWFASWSSLHYDLQISRMEMLLSYLFMAVVVVTARWVNRKIEGRRSSLKKY